MATQTITITKSVFDLDQFEDIKLVRTFDFQPAENTQEVLARIGNDAGKMLALLNEGLLEEERRNARKQETGWHTFEKDADGEFTDKINGEFTGAAADSGPVDALVLTLAKTVFGYGKGLSKELKQAAKESARDMIKSTPAIKAGLQAAAKKSEV